MASQSWRPSLVFFASSLRSANTSDPPSLKEGKHCPSFSLSYPFSPIFSNIEDAQIASAGLHPFLPCEKAVFLNQPIIWLSPYLTFELLVMGLNKLPHPTIIWLCLRSRFPPICDYIIYHIHSRALFRIYIIYDILLVRVWKMEQIRSVQAGRL